MDKKITALTSYTPAIDTDVMPIVDITTTTTKKITWANIKATLKTYFDTLYITSSSFTTSLQVKNQITDETGSGALVFATAPALSAPTGLVKGDVGLGNVDNTSDATKNSASATLTNKTLTKPTINAHDEVAQTYSPAGGATATLDLALANEHRITMPAGNITIALSNATNAQKFLISILQDGGGSRTVTWFSTIRWTGGVVPTLTTTGSKRDVFGFIRTGADTYDGYVVGQNI